MIVSSTCITMVLGFILSETPVPKLFVALIRDIVYIGDTNVNHSIYLLDRSM